MNWKKSEKFVKMICIKHVKGRRKLLEFDPLMQ